MEQVFEWLKNQLNIDLIIVVLVILSGFFQEKYLESVTISKNLRLNASLKTLFLSAIVSTIYIVLVYRDVKNNSLRNGVPADPMPWAKYFISYFTATSFYDFIIKPFRRFIQKKMGTDVEPETSTTKP